MIVVDRRASDQLRESFGQRRAFLAHRQMLANPRRRYRSVVPELTEDRSRHSILAPLVESRSRSRDSNPRRSWNGGRISLAEYSSDAQNTRWRARHGLRMSRRWMPPLLLTGHGPPSSAIRPQLAPGARRACPLQAAEFAAFGAALTRTRSGSPLAHRAGAASCSMISSSPDARRSGKSGP